MGQAILCRLLVQREGTPADPDRDTPTLRVVFCGEGDRATSVIGADPLEVVGVNLKKRAGRVMLRPPGRWFNASPTEESADRLLEIACRRAVLVSARGPVAMLERMH